MMEDDLQARFTRWLKSGRGFKWIREQGHQAIAYEVKLTKRNTCPFSLVPEHQEISLAQATGLRPDVAGGVFNKFTADAGLAHKLSDSAIGFLPFDGFAMVGAGAYLIIGYAYGGELYVYALGIADWLNFKYSGLGEKKRGSLEASICASVGLDLIVEGL